MFKSEMKCYADEMFSGRSTLVTAMGLSGSGKSYSLFGKEGKEAGMILRSVKYLLKRVTPEFELRASITMVHKDQVDNMIHSNMLSAMDEEIPIRSLDDLSIYLAQAIETRR